jgi:hypothetical protein
MNSKLEPSVSPLRFYRFAARIGVVLDEADESAFWLEIVTEDGLSKLPLAPRLLDEAN